MNSQINKDNKTGLKFILVLGALMAFTSFSTDIYLPAMPQMSKDLNGDAELTITGFLIGFAISQLIWGPISDRFGRKLPLFLGVIVFIIGSIGCALSDNITEIVFWRVFQAIGACTGPMLSRAMIRDLYTRKQAAHMLSTLMIIMAIAPIVGPLLGGQIIKVTSWKAIFWLLSAIGVVMSLALFTLPETLQKHQRNHYSIIQSFANYIKLLGNWKFMRFTLCITFYYIAAYAFITGSPFVYISYYKISPQNYGWLFAINVIGVVGLSFINRFLVVRYKLESLLLVASSIAMVAVVILAISVRVDFGGIYLMIATIFVFFSMNGIIAATSTVAALDDVPELAGAASALIGAMQYGSGIVSSLFLAWFCDGTPWTMAWIIALFTMLSTLMIYLKSR
ncbi:multidrug effflux MFS transporter [Celerinatantimonas sp. MCCC 1A17872]|uniref:multidrug effflux MFS transporter n=1 Tax=Celerinatantimonas sp. MCCC 1A17872 TaxID=3177514 RepID=UPI0038C2FBA3